MFCVCGRVVCEVGGVGGGCALSDHTMFIQVRCYCVYGNLPSHILYVGVGQQGGTSCHSNNIMCAIHITHTPAPAHS